MYITSISKYDIEKFLEARYFKGNGANSWNILENFKNEWKGAVVLAINPKLYNILLLGDKLYNILLL